MAGASSPPEVRARHADGHFGGQQGRSIYWQAWLPAGDPRAVLVISHGASEHGGRYRYVLERLIPEGFAIYAIDHRGHGRSEGQRAQIDRVSHVVADLDHLVEHARAAHAGLPLFLLGHSMGGCMAISYALRHQDKLHGLALSAPLAAMEAAPPPLRLAARILSSVTPGLGVYKVKAAAVSRDPEEVRAYEQDPLVYHGKLPARTVHEIAEAIDAFQRRASELTVPMLMLLPLADELVPPAGGRLVHDNASSPDKTLHEYEGYFHEQFNEPEGERERPLNDLADWLAARI